ncbi:MAG: hypothetical protein IPO92_09330 [Saprospiraceae bacterium]|nr:hypothetical protein [Saprospiraceae bacterium]
MNKGVSCIISGNTVTFTPLGDLDESCDKVVWEWLHNGTSSVTSGNQMISDTFPGPG